MKQIKNYRLVFLLLLSLATAAFAEEAKRPNILFILADDQSPTDLQMYNPSSELETPVLDKLAASGMVFDGAYHAGAWSGAVCQPSRIMIMSGRSTWHIPGGGNPNNNRVDLVPSDIAENSMAAIFNRAGYATMRTCKSGNSYAAGNAMFTVNKESVKRGDTDETGSAWHAEQVLNYLNDRQVNNDTKPFLIYYGFSHPHDPRNGKEGLLEKYGAVNHSDENSLPALNDKQPHLYSSYLPAQPFFHGHYNLRDETSVVGVWENRDEATIRNEMGREFACSENIDVQIGKVLDKLEEMGELENTYIFYTADHGIAIGKHGFQGKQNLYEHTWRVPFIVSGPGVQQGRAQGNIYLYDVLGTMCDLAGVTPPSTVESKSFKPVLEGQQNTVREVMFGSYSGGTKPGMRSVRKGDWKLIKYDVDNGKVHETQLFNLAENPDEYLIEHHAAEVKAISGVNPTAMQIDLAETADYADTLAMMEALLLEQMEANDDPYRLWNQPAIPGEEVPGISDSALWVDFTGAVAVANDTYNNSDTYSAAMAIDFETLSSLPNFTTRWATNASGPAEGWMLEVEFQSPAYFNHALIYDFDNRVIDFALDIMVDGAYQTVFDGTCDAVMVESKIYRKQVALDAHYTTTKLRYHIKSATKGPSTWGIQLYSDGEGASSLGELSQDFSLEGSRTVYSSLTLEAGAQVTGLQIYTLDGKQVLSTQQIVNNTVDLHHLEAGMYVVNLKHTDGSAQTFRILKV